MAIKPSSRVISAPLPVSRQATAAAEQRNASHWPSNVSATGCEATKCASRTFRCNCPEARPRRHQRLPTSAAHRRAHDAPAQEIAALVEEPAYAREHPMPREPPQPRRRGRPRPRGRASRQPLCRGIAAAASTGAPTLPHSLGPVSVARPSCPR
eukprot:3442235-Prymnesium_polylepis.2